MKISAKITPALVPHAQFHEGVWLLSEKRPVWYYYLKKKNPDIIKTKLFIKTVDRPLRKLVSLLHDKGIKTTPSCSGHHISERNLEEIYKQLEKDAEEIRTGGLKLKEVESGRIYHYQNIHYQLPWTLRKFVDAVRIYQKKGVLGFKPGNRKNAIKQLLQLKLPGVTVMRKKNVLLILTQESAGREIKDMWAQVTKEVVKILK